VVVPEARRRQRPASSTQEHESVRPGRAKRSRCSAISPSVTGEIVIERTDDGVFGSLRNHSPDPRRTSCSVTRTFRVRRSTRARRRPTNSLQRMPESTAR
jgi:hypothetical protein